MSKAAAVGLAETLGRGLLGGKLLLGILVEPAQQLAFEIGIGRLRARDAAHPRR